MKKYSFMDVLACVLPFVVLPLSFGAAAMIGESHIFSIGGILRYSWVMWLFAPIFLLPILLAIHKKKNFQPYIHLFIITGITLPLLLLFGSYRFLFANFIDYSDDCLPSIERSADVDIPDQVKMVTEYFDNMQDFDPYYESRIKITHSGQADAFEKEMAKDPRWVTELPTALKGVLPGFYQMQLQQFDYFLFYNITTNTYNTFPTESYNNCILLAYTPELNSFLVLHDLVVRPVL